MKPAELLLVGAVLVTTTADMSRRVSPALRCRPKFKSTLTVSGSAFLLFSR